MDRLEACRKTEHLLRGKLLDIASETKKSERVMPEERGRWRWWMLYVNARYIWYLAYITFRIGPNAARVRPLCAGRLEAHTHTLEFASHSCWQLEGRSRGERRGAARRGGHARRTINRARWKTQLARTQECA